MEVENPIIAEQAKYDDEADLYLIAQCANCNTEIHSYDRHLILDDTELLCDAGCLMEYLEITQVKPY